VLAPSTVVALCGALGLVAVAGPLAALRRTSRPGVPEVPAGQPDGVPGAVARDTVAPVLPGGAAEGRSDP
jgi:hypothetical protein